MVGLDPPCISRALVDEELSFLDARVALNVPVDKDNGGITPPGNRTGTVISIIDFIYLPPVLHAKLFFFLSFFFSLVG